MPRQRPRKTAQPVATLSLLFVETDPAPWKFTPDSPDPNYRSVTDTERGQALFSSPANAGNRLLTMSRSEHTHLDR